MCWAANVGATAQDGEDPPQTLCPWLRDAEYIEVGVSGCSEVGCAMDSETKVQCASYRAGVSGEQRRFAQRGCAPDGQ